MGFEGANWIHVAWVTVPVAGSCEYENEYSG
jgi:hypothetical protein